ncbi:hypothetical protein GOBAR_DD12528 [Gossypium barbadense]|nr:hypothetical protein GOBAR_DD12528 [Gossypium barbadense]
MFGALYLQCDPANICQYTALVRGRSYYAAPSTSAPPPYEDPFSYIKKGTSMMIQPSVSKFVSGYIEEEEEDRDTDTNTIEFSDPDHDEEVEAAEQECDICVDADFPGTSALLDLPPNEPSSHMHLIDEDAMGPTYWDIISIEGGCTSSREALKH